MVKAFADTREDVIAALQWMRLFVRDVVWFIIHSSGYYWNGLIEVIYPRERLKCILALHSSLHQSTKVLRAALQCLSVKWDLKGEESQTEWHVRQQQQPACVRFASEFIIHSNRSAGQRPATGATTRNHVMSLRLHCIYKSCLKPFPRQTGTFLTCCPLLLCTVNR